MTTLAVHRSRKLIPDFRLLRPREAAQAAAMQAESPEDAVYMAGGVDVANFLKRGRRVASVIHLGKIDGLRNISQSRDELVVGAGVTHDELPRSDLVRTWLPDLCGTWAAIGNIRIRLKGTIGGNVMAREPTYDGLVALMAAGAKLRFMAADGATSVIDAISTTDVRGLPISLPGLLVSIEIPRRTGLRLAFDRSLRPVLSLAVGLELDAGSVKAARVAFGCAFAAPFALALPIGDPVSLRDLGTQAADIAGLVGANLPEPLTDAVGSGLYRRRMAEVLLRRLLVSLVEKTT
jgi:carbon-monoxide dehydrogenase medium subunit